MFSAFWLDLSLQENCIQGIIHVLAAQIQGLVCCDVSIVILSLGAGKYMIHFRHD